MLTILSGILYISILVQSGRGAITHVFVLASVDTDTHFVTLTSIEARGCIGIIGVAYLVHPRAIDTSITLMTIYAMLTIDVCYLQPGQVGTRYWVLKGMVLVACGTLTTMVTFESARTGSALGIGEVRVGGVHGCDR
jgi:hypothetical protein